MSNEKLSSLLKNIGKGQESIQSVLSFLAENKKDILEVRAEDLENVVVDMKEILSRQTALDNLINNMLSVFDSKLPSYLYEIPSNITSYVDTVKCNNLYTITWFKGQKMSTNAKY